MKGRKDDSSICDICGVRAAHSTKRPQVLGRGAKMMLVDNVPVVACRNCGEVYMTSSTMHKLDNIRLRQKQFEATRTIEVAEFA